MEYKGVIDKTILLKVTSRGRKERLFECVKSYLEKAANPTKILWLFSFDHDDEQYNNLGFTDSLSHLVHGCYISFGQSNSKIHAINRDIESFTKINEWDILVNVSDDQHAIVNGWDTKVREGMPNDLDASLWFWDNWQRRINTMEIQGRKYYERFNYVYHPSYKSFYCDNEATEVAQRLGKLIKFNDCLFLHKHPAADNQYKNDALYDRNQKYWHEDKANFERRKLLNFED